MAEGSDGLQTRAASALRVLHQHYFWIHLSVQSICAAFFLAGSILTFFEATRLVARWVYLAGGLTFAALPIIRLLNEKAKNIPASPTGD